MSSNNCQLSVMEKTELVNNQAGIKSRSNTVSENNNKEFAFIAQNAASNQLARAMTIKLDNIDRFGHGQLTVKGFCLSFKNYRHYINTNGPVGVSAAKLLDVLLIQATADGLNNTLVTLPLKEYMSMRRLKNEDQTRQQAKRDIDALKSISYKYEGDKSWFEVALWGGFSAQNEKGGLFFRFSEEFFNSFKVHGKYIVMYLPLNALCLNDNAHPYSYWFARKIAEHKHLNFNKPTENIISTKTLTKPQNCPTFPTYEEVMATDRALTRRIIKPFERDMNALEDDFLWEYINGKPAHYRDFIMKHIQIYWRNYPPKSMGSKQQKGG